MKANERKERPYKGGLITMVGALYTTHLGPTYRWQRIELQVPFSQNEFYYYEDSFLEVNTLNYAKTVFDWLLENENKSSHWGVHTGDLDSGGLGVTLYRAIKFPHCAVPYVYRTPPKEPIPTLIAYPISKDAESAGWQKAERIVKNLYHWSNP